MPAQLPPDALSHAQAEALVQTLNGQLLAAPSATGVLEKWCGAHGLAGQPRIRAVLDRSARAAPGAEQRERLGVSADEPVRYRKVALMCGDRVLSVAENWFVPARLTPAMLKALDETDQPFGAVVAPLGINRRNLGAEQLWHPLAADWIGGAAGKPAAACEAVPQELLRHRALVFDRTGKPIAEVSETYQRDLLAFQLPWSARAAKGCRGK